MTIILYDLCGSNNARFSPYCWRAKMALAHKGLAFETRPTPFTEISGIDEGTHKTVPVIKDGNVVRRDSFDIALYLEEAYPDRASLFGGAGGAAAARFVESWGNATVNAGLVRMIVADVHARTESIDRDYFRDSREQRFGKPLEDVQADRGQAVEAFRASLLPLRMTLKRQPFVGGNAPLFVDYIVFGSFQWARVASPFQVLADDDPIREWFSRCLALHGELGQSEPAATDAA